MRKFEAAINACMPSLRGKVELDWGKGQVWLKGVGTEPRDVLLGFSGKGGWTWSDSAFRVSGLDRAAFDQAVVAENSWPARIFFPLTTASLDACRRPCMLPVLPVCALLSV
jgi:hypothetical protein